MRLLGLDQGLRTTGWGVIEAVDNRLSFIAAGTVNSDKDLSLAARLAQLHEGIIDVLRDFEPFEAAVEETFVNKNPQSTLKLGQARGAVLLAPALQGLLVAEYSPSSVKQTVVGSGRAGKDQVQMMVRTLLPGCNVTQADAADALAVAITHAHHRETARRIGALS